MLGVEHGLFAVVVPTEAPLESGHRQFGKVRRETRLDIREHDIGDEVAQFALREVEP